ncbi:MAG TPA: GNAT family protein [Steroidobacteraceae bacterium]|nr:GNAT family protein [Steroidobacteraceae bacterium]
MSWPESIVLSGKYATLEPLRREHRGDLEEATRDGELWKLWYTSVPSPNEMEAEIERRLALQRKGSMLPFAILETSSGRAVGMTTYMNIEAEHRRLEIGSTWYRAQVQRTALNTECKLLLLAHAFEALDCIAVEFRTSFFNHQSRKAIERLGAKLDGVLRSHRLMKDGSLRDTCVYSIIRCEWPAVKTHLQFQLDKPRR